MVLDVTKKIIGRIAIRHQKIGDLEFPDALNMLFHEINEVTSATDNNTDDLDDAQRVVQTMMIGLPPSDPRHNTLPSIRDKISQLRFYISHAHDLALEIGIDLTDIYRKGSEMNDT